MDVSELQKQIYLDGRRRCDELNGPDPFVAADASAAAQDGAKTRKIKEAAEAYWRKHGRPEDRKPEPPPAEPARKVGPSEAAALRWVDAVKRLKAGQTAEASSQSHKLAPHISYGG